MDETEKRITELDCRLSIVETKIDIHAQMIEEIKEIMSKLDEKIDKLIEIQSFGKWKHMGMWTGVGGGLLGLVHLILTHISGK